MLSFEKGDYENALTQFCSAIQMVPQKSIQNYYYASVSALKLKQYSLAETILINGIKRTNPPLSSFQNFEEFKDFRNLSFYKDIEENFEDYKKDFYQSLKSPEIYDEITTLVNKDRSMREKDNSVEEMKKADSLNGVRLIEITKEYGWDQRAFIILWHHRFTFKDDNFFWSFFRPYINEKIEKGEIEKGFWTNFEDNWSVYSNGIQKYGTYWGQLKEYPIENIKIIDSLRLSVDLPPLWFMEKIYGAELPKGYDYPEDMDLENYRYKSNCQFSIRFCFKNF